MKTRKPLHDPCKVTNISGRSANISAARLRIEEFMASNVDAFTSKEVAAANNCTTHNASRVLRDMRRVNMICPAGTDPVRGKPRWAHRDHVSLHDYGNKPERASKQPTERPRQQAHPDNITPPRVYTNLSMPNGSPEYWARMMAWGRLA